MGLQRRPRRVLALLLVAAVAALAAGGCGSTVIDDSKTEALVKQDLRDSLGKKVSSVSCPSGVDVEPGATFECTVTLAGGKKEVAMLEIVNEEADLEMTGLSEAK